MSAEGDERFRLFVESVTEYAMFLLDTEGHVQTWNAGARLLKGWEREEIVGRHFSVFYPHHDVEKCNELLREAERTGRFAAEGWRVRKDGSLFWASVVITPVRDEGGRLIAFGKVTRDLSERRRAEERLRQSEERLRLIVDSIRDYAVFMLSTDGTVITWNPGAERIKGYTASEIVGHHFSAFYPPEDVRAGKCESELEIAARDGRFEEEGWRVRKDGTRFWANVVISAVVDEEGKLIGFSKVTRDLTERRRADEERLRLAQAEEAVRLRDEFLSIASHELKTPLTSLLLQLEGVEHRLEDGMMKRGVARAIRSGQRLTALIETLLDVSRISTGKLTLSREPFDLGEAVADVCDRMREEAARAHVDLRFHRGAPVRGEWDRLRVEQIVSNLLANALKYAPGTPIDVTVDAARGFASVVVSDRGPGVPADDLARIFGRFERAVPMKHFGGLGLGLYVSKEIASAHGGELRAENLPEGGARFTLNLPL